MAIAKLVNVGYQKDATSEPRRAFHYTDKDKPKTTEKVSSSMFSDSMVSSVIDSIRNYNSQIAKLQDISRGLIISFKGLVVMVRQLNKDITSRFRVLNKELDSSKLDFVRNVLTSTKTEERTVGSSLAAEMPKEEPKKEDPKKEEEKSSFLEDLMDLLGVGGRRAAGAAGRAGGSLLRGLGAAISNPIVAGFLGAGAATVAAIFGTAAVGDYLMDKLGINKLIAEREKSEEYQQLRRTQEEAAASARNRNVGDVKEQRNQSITEFLKSKGLGGPEGIPRGSEIRRIGDNVTIISKGHPDEGKTFNFITGQEVGSPQPQTPAAPAAPTGSPQQAPGADKPSTPPAQTGAPEGAAPAAAAGGGAPAPAGGGSVDPEIAARAANYREMGRQGIALPDNIASDPISGKMAITAHQEGAAERNAAPPEVQGPPMPPAAGPPKSAAARKREALNSLGAPAPATPAPTAPPAPPETPKMETPGGGAPVVVNNNNVQSTSNSSGGEGNNVVGQNFPLTAVDPFVSQYLEKVTPTYQ